MKTALFTNGLFLVPDGSRKLDGILDELTLPIDGSTPKVHSRSRGVEDGFHVSLALLELCHSLTVRADVSTVVSRQNIDDIYNIGALLVDNGVRKGKLFQFAPIARARRIESKFGIASEVFRKVTNGLDAFRDRLEIDVRATGVESMQSYLHLSPAGDMLIVRDGAYCNIGNIIRAQDIFTKLQEEGFNYTTHRCRHRRDIMAPSIEADVKRPPMEQGEVAE
jgi:MoaA/NifB/PqqE/SkfB family radical SAM enzyme